MSHTNEMKFKLPFRRQLRKNGKAIEDSNGKFVADVSDEKALEFIILACNSVYEQHKEFYDALYKE